MKKILAISLFVSSFLYSATLDQDYNECKNQLFVANGNGLFALDKKDAKKKTIWYTQQLSNLLINRRDIYKDIRLNKTL